MKNIHKCVQEIRNIQNEYAQQETTKIIEEEYDVIKQEIYNAILLAAQNNERECVYEYRKPYYVPYELRYNLIKHFRDQGFDVCCIWNRLDSGVVYKDGYIVFPYYTCDDDGFSNQADDYIHNKNCFVDLVPIHFTSKCYRDYAKSGRVQSTYKQYYIRALRIKWQ